MHCAARDHTHGNWESQDLNQFHLPPEEPCSNTGSSAPAPGGHLAMSADIFGCHDQGGRCCWHLDGGSHGCSGTSQRAQGSSPTTETTQSRGSETLVQRLCWTLSPSPAPSSSVLPSLLSRSTHPSTASNPLALCVGVQSCACLLVSEEKHSTPASRCPHPDFPLLHFNCAMLPSRGQRAHTHVFVSNPNSNCAK